MFETSTSRHNGGTIEDPHKTPRYHTAVMLESFPGSIIKPPMMAVRLIAS